MHITLRIVQFENPKDFLSEIIFQEFISIKFGQKITIGRSDECEICVDDDYCSAFHAIVEFKDESLLISDSLSKNGTKLNKVNVRSQVPVYIKDVISVGKTYIHIDEDKTDPEMKKKLIRSKDDDDSKVYLPTDDFLEITRVGGY